jgi:serine/threonine-protein kinase
MNNESIPVRDHGGKEEVMERKGMEDIESLIVAATAGSVARAGGMGDVDFAAELTDGDLAALAARGTPAEQADTIMSRLQGTLEMTLDAAESTYWHDRAASETVPGDAAATPPSPAYLKLLLRHRDFHRLEHIEWGNQFERKEKIGRGRQGVVYRIECANPFFGSRALKVMSPTPYGNEKDYHDDMARMVEVASTVHQNVHDNLIHVERFEAYNDVFVMVMRLIDGLDLQRLLHSALMEKLKQGVKADRWDYLCDVVFARCGMGLLGLKPGVAVNVAEKILRALRALHKENIVHCDIKLSNIMLDRYGSIRLIDIGSAFHLEAPPRRHAWTPRYAPPEVLEGGPWTPQGDLASLGYVLIELLSGRPDMMGPVVATDSTLALDDATRAELIKAKRELPQRLHELLPYDARQSDNLNNLCRMLTDPDPGKRFDSAATAILCTACFKNDLVRANMGMNWVQDIEYWVLDAMATESRSPDCA